MEYKGELVQPDFLVSSSGSASGAPGLRLDVPQVEPQVAPLISKEEQEKLGKLVRLQISAHVHTPYL